MPSKRVRQELIKETPQNWFPRNKRQKTSSLVSTGKLRDHPERPYVTEFVGEITKEIALKYEFTPEECCKLAQLCVFLFDRIPKDMVKTLDSFCLAAVLLWISTKETLIHFKNNKILLQDLKNTLFDLVSKEKANFPIPKQKKNSKNPFEEAFNMMTAWETLQYLVEQVAYITPADFLSKWLPNLNYTQQRVGKLAWVAADLFVEEYNTTLFPGKMVAACCLGAASYFYNEGDWPGSFQKETQITTLEKSCFDNIKEVVKSMVDDLILHKEPEEELKIEPEIIPSLEHFILNMDNLDDLELPNFFEEPHWVS